MTLGHHIGSKNPGNQILRLFFLFYLLAWLVLRTFPVHLGLSSLLVLLFTDPHLLERPQRGQYGSSDPGSVSSLLRSVGRDQFEPHG